MVFIDLHKGKETERPSCALSLAIGNFDGVHIGHAALILRAAELAREFGAKSGAWCFDSPPSDILLGRGAVPQLLTLEEKLDIFASLGLDFAVLGDFAELKEYSPGRFAREILYEECRARAVVCGFNFRFGANGAGDADTLCGLFASRGCRAEIIPAVKLDGEVVSSSIIRSMLGRGETERAAAMLGRPYFIKAKVVHGKGLGRKFGIPTINQIFPSGSVIPENGVYACRCEAGGEEHIGVSNVGRRPTAEKDGEVNCETYILDFDRDIYGEEVKLSFYRRIRDERKFDSLDALFAEVRKNAEFARNYFEEKSKGGK